MTENKNEQIDNLNQKTMEEIMELFDDKFSKFAEGELVKGLVLAVDRDYVLVDVGYKSEGKIPIREFKGVDKDLDIKIGEEIEVIVEKWDEDNEEVKLSKEKAVQMKIWDKIREYHESDEQIEGIITNRIKGGFSVDLGGLIAFLPGSQTDIKPIRNLDELIDIKHSFKVLKYNRKRNNIVLSRRAVLEAKREASRTEVLNSIFEGKEMEGAVKNITDYGVFVDLGNIDGLLHITDISWGRVKHPSEFFKIGDIIKVKILSVDKDKERVSLGMKQLVEDPWIDIDKKYPIGSRVKGKVVSIVDYGAFIEIEEGVEGLIHVSEMSWTKKIRNPSKILSIGNVIEASVLDLQADKRRISLGMKQLFENPWDSISSKFPVGSIIEGKIKNITDFGLFIGIDGEIDGLVHISDISWTKRIKHPSELYKKGDTVKALVRDIDKDNERFSLSIKDVEKDPWLNIEEKYKVGDIVDGVITNITEFGIFMQIKEGIEGLIHISEIGDDKMSVPIESNFKSGDQVTAKILNLSGVDRKLGLSIKQLKSFKQKEIKEEGESLLGNNIEE